jgi:hypothetical protein
MRWHLSLVLPRSSSLTTAKRYFVSLAISDPSPQGLFEAIIYLSMTIQDIAKTYMQHVITHELPIAPEGYWHPQHGASAVRSNACPGHNAYPFHK